MLFRISFLCPTPSQSRAVGEVGQSWYVYMTAAITLLASLGLAANVALLKDKANMSNRSTAQNLAVFFAICGITLAWLAVWRGKIVS